MSQTTLLKDAADRSFNGSKSSVTPEKFIYEIISTSQLFSVYTSYSQEDIQYIADNFDDLGSPIWSVKTGGDNFGLFWFVKRKLEKDIEISTLEIELFIKLMLKYEYLDSLMKEVLFKLVQKYEDKFFTLISFEKYKFETFDLRITERLNTFLSNPGTITGLNKAYFKDNGYYWEAEGEDFIEVLNQNVFDDSLFRRETDFRNPLDKIDQKLEVNLEGGFSSLKINGLATDADPTGFLGYKPDFLKEKIKVEDFYINFLVDFIKNVLSVEEGEFEYVDADVEDIFEAQVSIFLVEGIKFETGTAIIGTENLLPLQEYIAKLILDKFRYNIWRNLAKQLKGKGLEELRALGDNSTELNNSFADAAVAAANLDVIQEDPDAEDSKTSDEDKQARKKFLKQCMLMTRLDDLADENLTRIASLKNNINDREFTHYKSGRFAPYRNRFYMVEDSLYTAGDQTSTVNKLVIPNGNSIREFLDMKPSTHAYLVPKLRFYKVYTDKTGNLKEFQFHFRNFTDPNRVNRLSEPNRFDRGGDYGIKEFNFSFDGTNPATAKNDIKANLSLYFQTFGDFIDKKFTDEDGDKHAFVDLLLLPSGKKKDGSGAPAIAQYNAKYYRIRADVGWEIESTRVKDLEQSLGATGIANLRNSLRLMNKSFYLNMVDHTMDFRDDGSIQIDVEYRAYIESALKGTTMDALASPESRRALKKVRKDYETLLSKQRCSAKELNEIRLQLEQIEDLFKKHAYQSIMKRLVVNGAIKFKKVKADAQARSFLRQGYFTSKVSFASDVEEPNNEQQNTSKITTHFKTNENGFVDLKNSDDFLYLNYFYLGDLLYAIMDTLYDENENYHEGLEKFKFVLGSFQYEDLLDANAQAKVINLANIPVSCELFFEWFTENIIKPERNSYPIMFFIRDLAKYLITEILSESCFKRSFDKTLQFKTMSFMGLSADNKDPLGKLFNYSSDDIDVLKDAITLDVGKHYRDNNLPLPNDLGSNVSISDYYNYIAVYIDTPRQRTNKDASTTKALDEQDGIMHYKIGRDRGILKKIKFSKSDMQYIREARFFRHGHDGLMQLSAVYKVSMDMIGNTLYYPGMEVFIDPLGLVGANSDADPRQKRSIANRLGFGGYHLVTSVKSSIGPGKFTTNVEAMFSYSGDGDPSSRVIGKKIEIKDNDGQNLIDEAQDNRPQSYKDYCATVKDKVITKAARIARYGGEYAPIDYNAIEDNFAGSSVNAEQQSEIEVTETPAGTPLDEFGQPLTSDTTGEDDG